MTEKIYSIFITTSLSDHLAESCSRDDSDLAKRFRAWGKCLGDHSKQFLSLADAIERENSNGADIKIDFFGVDQITSIGFHGSPGALKRLAEQGLIEDITDENED